MKNLHLLLTTSCSKQWDDMTPTGKGRYCESCEKNIVDLTAKSDAELVKFFHKKKDNVCGRLLSSQLNRDLVIPPTKASWQWLLPLAIGAILANPSQANELRPVAVQNDQQDSLPSNKPETSPKVLLTASTIEGNVVDNTTGKALKGVKVRQKGFENVLAVTDSAGRFDLKITEGNLTTLFTFALDGYSQVDWKIADGNVIKLSQQILSLGGISFISFTAGPLYHVYAGKKSCTISQAKFREISTDWIEKIEILKDAEAAALFGSRGANGVVFVEIKKEYAKKVNFSKKD